MTIVIAFHQSGFRDFKTFYTQLVCVHWREAFPKLVSYIRMLKLVQTVLVLLCSYLTQCKVKPTGIAYVDSTLLKICQNLRIPRHKVFADMTARGKGTIGWFDGFKLHLIVNNEGGILVVKVTAGNTVDRVPVPEMVEGLSGALY